jgi:gas vesicle protein
MKILATYFRAKAELCRELADTLSDQRNHVASKLRSMADEFEQNASVLEDRLADEGEAEEVQSNEPDHH